MVFLHTFLEIRGTLAYHGLWPPFKVGNHTILRFFIMWNISAVGPLCKTTSKLWKKKFNKCFTQLNYMLCLMCWYVVFYYTTSSMVKGPLRLNNSYHRKCKTIKTYRTCIWGNQKQCRRWFSKKCQISRSWKVWTSIV
jgi:hypothetical protein